MYRQCTYIMLLNSYVFWLILNKTRTFQCGLFSDAPIYQKFIFMLKSNENANMNKLPLGKLQ